MQAPTAGFFLAAHAFVRTQLKPEHRPKVQKAAATVINMCHHLCVGLTTLVLARIQLSPELLQRGMERRQFLRRRICSRQLRQLLRLSRPCLQAVSDGRSGIACSQSRLPRLAPKPADAVLAPVAAAGSWGAPLQRWESQLLAAGRAAWAFACSPARQPRIGALRELRTCTAARRQPASVQSPNMFTDFQYEEQQQETCVGLQWQAGQA
jgi:hypothetical protein